MLSIHSGLLASTLECYYNASCLQLFVPNSFIFQPSKTTLPSRFTPQGTIANVANQSLTEILSYNFSHAEYYMQCAPRVCVCSYEYRSSALTIVTTIIGVLSGLNRALHLFIPIFVKQLMKFWNKFHSKPCIVLTATTSVIPSCELLKATH
ncbi:unnamed protein product [Adineta ricciae]|uniref:Uncharacterized protein n=1 Tax=Adineta ricciae TaxID=249248 RepID=A0A814Z7B5_ADIRI|nr:unnamed protein product [Adineta ricciae]